MTTPSHVEVLEELAKKWEREAVVFASIGSDISTAEAAVFSNLAKDLRAAIALMRAPVGDAERFAFLASKARQDRSYDVFGNGGHWGIGLHSQDGNLSFREAVDAAMQQTTKEGWE